MKSTWHSRLIKKINKKKFSYSQILIILLAGCALFYAYLLTNNSCLLKDTWCGQDMDQYIDYSDNILSGHGYTTKKVSNIYYVNPATNTEYIPEVLRLPSYPVLLTLGRIFYSEPPLVLIYNFIFYLLILLYSFLITRMFLSGWPLLLVFFIVSFNPTLLFYTALFGNADTFAASALLGFVYHALRIYTGKFSKMHIVLASIFGLMAIFSRQNVLLFIIPFLLLMLFAYYRGYIEKYARNALLFILGVLLFSLSAWIYRNYTITGKPVISAMSGIQLFSEHIYFSPEIGAEGMQVIKWLYGEKGAERFIDEQQSQGKNIPQAYLALNGHVNKITIEYILGDPLRTTRHYFHSIYSFYTVTTFTWEKEDLLSFLKKAERYINFTTLILLPFLPLIYFGSKRKQYFLIITLWLSVSVFIYVSAFYHGTVIGNRGLLPIFPLQLMLCTIFITFVLSTLKTYISKRLLKSSKERK